MRACIDPATNQFTFDLLGLDGGCTLTSGGSLVLVGVGSRIESDPEVTVGASPDISTQSFPAQASQYVLQKAFATNVRRYRTISIVHLRWGTYDLAKAFGGKCASADCNGYFQYLPALQKYLVLSGATIRLSKSLSSETNTPHGHLWPRRRLVRLQSIERSL